MYWPRIRQNECPACGRRLQEENDGRLLTCPMCPFQITPFDRARIIQNMNRREQRESGEDDTSDELRDRDL